MTHVNLAYVIAALLLCASACAQTAPAPGLEPGEAEARERSRVIDPALRWTHPRVEARGVWIASRDMTGRKADVLKRLDRVRDAGLNTALIDTWFRGYVAYPGSAVALQFPDFNGDDVLGWMIEECHRRGLRAEAWIEYGFYAYFTPDATKDSSMGAILDKHPELLSVDDKGNPFIHRSFGDYYSICPSNPKSHELLAAMCVEVVRKYAVDGLNLDRIRYAEANYCYCDYCKEQFRKDTGVALVPFAAGSDGAKTFLQWKREQTAKAVAHIVTAVRTVKPHLPITSYVVGPTEMDDKAQGWDLWADRGLVDAVAVSMYGADVSEAARRAVELLHGNRAKLICAISADQKPDIFASNVEVARGFTPIGQFVWHLGDLQDDDVAALRAGPYRTNATYPFGSAAPAP